MKLIGSWNQKFIRETNKNLKYCSSQIENYPLKYDKCALQCYENVDKFIEHVKKHNRMPCNNEWTIHEYYIVPKPSNIGSSSAKKFYQIFTKT